ncbi:MAG: hypothetical protein ABH856_04870 [Patescibacteria group bacterium]
MPEVKIGKITHVFGNIGVGVVELTGSVAVGDKIIVRGHDREFKQAVDSIQVEHTPVESAAAKQSVGMKFGEEIKDGDMVYKVSG